MPFLQVGATILHLSAFAEREPAVRGEVARAFDNTLLVGTDSGKREWEGDTIPLTAAQAAAVRAAIAQPVLVSGDASSPATTCHVTVRGARYARAMDPVTRQMTSYTLLLSLLFQEV